MIGVVALALAAGCSPGGEFEPPLCPNRLPPVTAIKIEEQGVALWRDPDPGPPCTLFRLRESDVLRFLRDAGRADPHDVHYTLPESPCAVRGRVRFADGSHGQRRIDGSRSVGSIARVAPG